ncbi:hypothetical protein AS52_03652 [Priestia megaterium Q3]|uniref:Uncharacterized protein n=1 Tax=Priestia megaterium Q3 TaxID=1452722 RepID=A0A806U8S9_PRIMG|nr:hypothetical protein [Priestia megaterium]AKP78613.1 hypothetical protein AS52_03652 [Priestia megaterium Q3]
MDNNIISNIKLSDSVRWLERGKRNSLISLKLHLSSQYGEVFTQYEELQQQKACIVERIKSNESLRFCDTN